MSNRRAKPSSGNKDYFTSGLPLEFISFFTVFKSSDNNSSRFQVIGTLATRCYRVLSVRCFSLVADIVSESFSIIQKRSRPLGRNRNFQRKYRGSEIARESQSLQLQRELNSIFDSTYLLEVSPSLYPSPSLVRVS